MSEPATAYAAARLLGRDRQTVQRVVDRLSPDDFRNGRPRWHVERIAAVLAMSPSQRREAGRFLDRYGIRHKPLADLRVAFEQRLAAIKNETAPDKRHAMAVALATLLAEYEATYLSAGRSLRIADDDVLGFRTDLILEEMIGEVAQAAGRDSDSTFFAEMNEAMAHADDEAA